MAETDLAFADGGVHVLPGDFGPVVGYDYNKDPGVECYLVNFTNNVISNVMFV